MYIPKILDDEFCRLRGELDGEYIGVAFDGTTRLGEAINVTARWCSEDFRLQTRLIDFETLKHHAKHEELAAHINEVIMQKRGIAAKQVVNFSRDSVAVNGAACRVLMQTFRAATSMLCICHTLCHVGERFELPTLKEFMTPWLELVGGRDPHRGAQSLWKETMAPTPIPGFSKVRWYSKAEIIFVIAEAGMKRLGDFIIELETRDYGDASRAKLREVYEEKTDSLRLELAAMLDMRDLVRTTYELEGDRLELLLVHQRVEALRARGRAIASKADGALPNIDAVLRRIMTLKKGVKMEKYFHGYGVCSGKLAKMEKVNSTLYNGQERDAWLVKYEDDSEEHFEEEELRSGKVGPAPADGKDGKPVLVLRGLPERDAICDALAPGFSYLEDRLTGRCDAPYSCVDMYEICRLVQAFDPNFAAAHMTPSVVDAMQIITPLQYHGMLGQLKTELPAYLAEAAQAPAFDRAGDVGDYTEAILTWWRVNGNGFPAWAEAARIVFALAPNSASCERVFARLKKLFGDEQMSALADYIQAALMLAYNGRRVG